MKICNAKSCEREANGSRGYCHGHYGRLSKLGDIRDHIPLAPHVKRKECEVDGCKNLNVSTKLHTGLCNKHYGRLARGVDVYKSTPFDSRSAILEGEIAKIPLGVEAKDGYALVDKEFAWVDKYKWRLSNDGYPVTNSFGQRGYNNRLHHLVIGREKGMVVDHISRDKLDNRTANLRHASYSLNTINRGLQSNNKSGYRGVFWHKETSSWVAVVARGGKNTTRYGFATPEEAAKVYEELFKKVYGNVEVELK
jgi:hypothetical protein